MSTIKFFLLLSLLILIHTEENNATKEPEKEAVTNPPSEEAKTEETEKEPPRFKNPGPYNMTYDEMDIMVVCTYIVQNSLKAKKTLFDEIAKKLGFNNTNQVIEKAGTDVFEKCLDDLNITTANKFVKNLTYLNEFEWQPSFDKYLDIDFNNKYQNMTDLAYTQKQTFLLYKFQKVNELYRHKWADTKRSKDESESNKIKIGKFDIQKLPNGLKIFLFLGSFALLFGLVLYSLKSLGKQKISNKEKKRKKKTQ